MNEKNPEEHKDHPGSNGLAVGMCLGISAGSVLGVITGNLGVWMPTGLSVGMCLGLAIGSARTKADGKRDEK